MTSDSRVPRDTRERVHVVVAGHVDHGKSTMIGRLLADSNALPEGKLAHVRRTCERLSRPFEYAFLLDALREEQAQGITIDAARVFFSSDTREYVLFDTPGHTEFLRNMMTGASHATAAFLVVDVEEGIRESSRRHACVLSMLGFRHVVIVVNKMDRAKYDRARFDTVVEECRRALQDFAITPSGFIPISGLNGDNVVHRMEALPWYEGPTVLDAMDAFPTESIEIDRPFRMPVQGVYKFGAHGDQRRIVAGRISSGRLASGDALVFYPSGQYSHVKRIEDDGFVDRGAASAGHACGFTLEDELFVQRGELAVRIGEPTPAVGKILEVTFIWLGRRALALGEELTLRHGPARVRVRVELIRRVVDMANTAFRENEARIQRHEVAECVLRASHDIAVDDQCDTPTAAPFVLVRDYEIEGGGIVRGVFRGEYDSAVRGSPSASATTGA